MTDTTAAEERPLTASVLAGDRVVGEVMKIRFYPFVAAGAEGTRMRDPDGREYLDFMASGAVMAVGYRHPRVRDAAVAALDTAWSSTPPSHPHPWGVALARRLIDIVPVRGKKRVWFGHCGSDAMDCIAQLLPFATGRSRIVSFTGSYHGQTGASSVLSGHPSQARRPGSPNVTKAPYPYPYRCRWGPCSEQECSLACLRHLEEHVLGEESPASETAAVVIEAIQSDGGDVVPPANFLPALRELCDRHGISLVFDEVKIGFGRTGRWFGYEHAGIAPEAVGLGKAIGGGLPLSAVVGPSELLDADVGTISYTIGGGPAPCAAGLATLDVIEQDRLVERAAETGAYLLDGLRDLARRHPLVGDVRGRGLIAGVELVRDRETREPATRETQRLVYRLYELGLLTIYTGTDNNVVELTPPLTVERREVDEALDLLDRALADLEAGRFDDAKLADYSGW